MTEGVGKSTGTPSMGSEAVGWEEPRPALSGTAPTLSVEGFEGPLDWLLELAQARRIDLARLSIAALIEAFAAAMDAALSGHDGNAPARLGPWSDWLVMAATLVLLRSRLLRPAGAPEATAAASEAEALRRRLIGRAQARAAADWLEQQPQLGREVFARGAPEEGAFGQAPARTLDLTALLQACLVALRLPEEARVYLPRLPPLWRVSDATARIEQMLDARPEGGKLAIFLPRIDDEASDRELRCRAALASTLVAGLELARGGALMLDQNETWTPIRFVPCSVTRHGVGTAPRASTAAGAAGRHRKHAAPG